MDDLEEDDEGVEGGVKPISSRVVGGGVEMSGGGEKEDVGAQIPVEGDAGLTMKVSEMVGAEVKEDTGLAAKAPNDVEFNAGLEKVQEAINGEVKEAAESQPPIPLPTIAQPTTASGSLFPSLPTTDTLDPASNPQEQTRSLAVPVLRIHAEDGSLLPDDTHTNEYIDDAFEDDFVEEDIIDDDDDFFDQPLTRPTVENTIIEPENTVIPKPALTPLNSMPLKPVMGGLGALPPLQSKLPALLPGMKPLASTTSTSVLGAPKSLDSLDAKPTLSHDIHPTPSQTSPSSDATPPLSNVTTSTPNVKPTPDTKPPPDIFTDRDSEEDIDLDDDIDNLLAHRRLLDSNTHWLKQPSPDPGKMSWLEGGGIGEVLEEEEDFAFDVDVEDEASLEVDGEDAF
ncbi:hypothetical protein BC829DRAFT_398009 [Chytridium lagenaria]|nr:hypothetical protein BC829DRAFT_398009 [Chytridium lagenaria]